MTEKLRVPPDLEGMRLDVVIARLAPHISRRAARRLVDDGAVFVDGKRVQVCSRPMKNGATIEIGTPPPAETADRAPDRTGTDAPALAEAGDGAGREHGRERGRDGGRDDVRILALDRDLVVVDKPGRMPTEPTRDGARGTLQHALQHALEAKGEDVTFLHAIHRLDTHTTGVVVFARNKSAAHHVGRQLQDGTVERRYLALVHGVPAFARARIDVPLARSRDADGKIRVDADGAAAVTLATVLAPGVNGALALCAPRTGRTHQLRVHLQEAGHALVGDRVYAGTRAPHLGLHALSLGFTHPNGTPVRYAAQPPRSFHDAALAIAIPGVVVDAVARHLAPEML